MTALIQRTMVDRLTVKMPMTKRLTCLSVLTLSAELIIIFTTARATGLEKTHFNHLITLWWSWSSCGGISIVFAVAICMHSTELMNESVIMYGWADVTQNAGHFDATRLSKQSRFQQRKQKQENSMNLHYATLLSVRAVLHRSAGEWTGAKLLHWLRPLPAMWTWHGIKQRPENWNWLSYSSDSTATDLSIIYLWHNKCIDKSRKPTHRASTNLTKQISRIYPQDSRRNFSKTPVDFHAVAISLTWF